MSDAARDSAPPPADLRLGSRGEPVRDLQRRLAGLGRPVPVDEIGAFGDATERAVRAFQEARGLRVDGICGPETWAAMVESGFRLGDRLLYRRRPMLRGDDVKELQTRLNALGFDAGREDGILGDDTASALGEFQRNAGITSDGICGPATVATLTRLSALAEGSVASVRERESLRQAPLTLTGYRVFVAAAPGLEPVAGAVVEQLVEHDAETLLDTAGAPGPAIAAAANEYGADLFLGLAPGEAGSGCRCSYFESGRFRSEAGFRVASAIFTQLERVLQTGGGVCGRTYAVLRETRMAAVLCEPFPVDDTGAPGSHPANELARAVVHGIRSGLCAPSTPE